MTRSRPARTVVIFICITHCSYVKSNGTAVMSTCVGYLSDFSTIPPRSPEAESTYALASRTTSPSTRLKAELTYGGQDDKSTEETEG